MSVTTKQSIIITRFAEYHYDIITDGLRYIEWESFVFGHLKSDSSTEIDMFACYKLNITFLGPRNFPDIFSK